jgi:hypothetical protein
MCARSMADEPDNLVLKILHDIRQDQVKQSFAIEAQAQSLRSRFDMLHETLAFTRGLAAHGQVRLDLNDRRLDDLEARIARLESG